MFHYFKFVGAIGLLLGFLLWLSTQTQAKPLPYWRLPVAPPMKVLDGFAAPNPNWLPGHRGIDLEARNGSQVVAPSAGVITFADQLAGRGVVVIQHGSVRSTYEPVTPSLKVGEYVVAGDVIGRVDCGISHCCRGLVAKCLHWGLKQGPEYLNPLSRLDLRVVLLPD